MFAGKGKGVEIVGAAEDEKEAGAEKDDVSPAEGESSEGPETGEEAPLFDPDGAIGSRIGLEDGELVITFTKNTKTWDLTRGKARFATAIASAYIDEMRVIRRGHADADGADSDYGCDVEVKQGVVRIKFEANLKKFRIRSKNAAKRFVRHIRADAASLPPSKGRG